jgi:5-methylthioadenosine/S-adenosylhomocysteine deaminase
MAMKTIIRGARVLTMDPVGTDWPQATVTIENDTIVAVEAGTECSHGPPGACRPASACARSTAGHLLMPGLVNAHFHSSANHLKGSFDSLPLEIFMLFETPADGRETMRGRPMCRPLLGAVEMLKSGVTTVLDDAFFVPAPSPAAIDAIMQAYADSGIRASVALDQPNVPEIDKLPFSRATSAARLLARARAPAAMDAAGLLACYRHLIERWHGAAGGRLRAAVSCSAPQRVTVDYFKRWMRSAASTICRSSCTCSRPSCNVCSARRNSAAPWCATSKDLGCSAIA